MTARRDPDSLIRTFLEDGPTEMADRSYDEVRAHIDNTRQRVVLGPWKEPRMNNFARFAMAAAVVLVAAVIGLNLLPGGWFGPAARSKPVNGWIAISTVDGDVQNGSSGLGTGSDIYLVREGQVPFLVAGRQGGRTLNVCPVFSPDGTWLAFGEGTSGGGTGERARALVLLRVGTDRSLSDTVRITIPSSPGHAVCPLWSVDGARIAYVDGAAVVVHKLDGSSSTPGEGDPRIDDFQILRASTDPLMSPTGDRIAQSERDGIVVRKPDGSDRHLVASAPPPIAWSPDGTKLLYIEDEGDAFGLHQVTADPPYGTVTLVSGMPLNGWRNFPGRGDVSWQPVYP